MDEQQYRLPKPIEEEHTPPHLLFTEEKLMTDEVRTTLIDSWS